MIGDGWLNPRGPEIRMVIRIHGPTVPHMVEQQIHTFNGGCEFGESNEGLCEDV